MKFRAESAEVFYPNDEVVVVDATDIESLKRAALASPRKRARICTHRASSDGLHEMLIVLRHGSYVRPHKHIGKIESFSIFEGEADIVLFHDDGTVREVIPMGPVGSGRTFYYRLSEPTFHTVIVHSESLVFHEVTDGPFRREQTVFATWSAQDDDTAGVSRFLKSFPRP